MKDLKDFFIAIVSGIIIGAIITVIVSQRSNSVGVIQSFSAAFSNALTVAEKPVASSATATTTGASTPTNIVTLNPNSISMNPPAFNGPPGSNIIGDFMTPATP